ncbi:MAG TPA: hypothetical protein VJ719_04095 [Chthoniobacterales bacterium]|nr:hypothetical protein [Chthoniobacterales bacterium]
MKKPIASSDSRSRGGRQRVARRGRRPGVVPPGKPRVGLAIGFIGKFHVPTRWAMHVLSASHNMPGGLFWTWVYSMADFRADPTQSYASLRNQVVRQAQERNCRWLLFVDTDVFFPPDTVSRLMRHQKAIVSGIYWTKSEASAPVVIETFGNGPIWKRELSEELLPIDASGLGCCLIDMQVFDAFDRAGFPYFVQDWTHSKNGQTAHVDTGEDYYFFLKAKELGFQTYADTRVLCQHYDESTDQFFPDESVLGPKSAIVRRSDGFKTRNVALKSKGAPKGPMIWNPRTKSTKAIRQPGKKPRDENQIQTKIDQTTDARSRIEEGRQGRARACQRHQDRQQIPVRT